MTSVDAERRRKQILECLATMRAARLVESESTLAGGVPTGTDRAAWLTTCRQKAIERIGQVDMARFDNAHQHDDGLLASIIGESLDAD